MPLRENSRIGQANRIYKNKGVTLENGRFRARLYVERKPFHIGNYSSMDEAMFNYKINYKEWFGYFPEKQEIINSTRNDFVKSENIKLAKYFNDLITEKQEKEE